MKRTEGVYIYICEKCETLFAVVSRFSVNNDYFQALKCPKCNRDSSINGEGYINYQVYESDDKKIEIAKESVEMESDGYPIILTADHVAKIVGVSKRVAYELMERKDFPLIRLGRSKRVNKNQFFHWMNNQK